jgi:hypothetical protein
VDVFYYLKVGKSVLTLFPDDGGEVGVQIYDLYEGQDDQNTDVRRRVERRTLHLQLLLKVNTRCHRDERHAAHDRIDVGVQDIQMDVIGAFLHLGGDVKTLGVKVSSPKRMMQQRAPHPADIISLRLIQESLYRKQGSSSI